MSFPDMTMTKLWSKRVAMYFIRSFSILSDDRSKASSKTIPRHSAIWSFLVQMRVSSPVFFIQ